jgi:hypothetical protein
VTGTRSQKASFTDPLTGFLPTTQMAKVQTQSRYQPKPKVKRGRHRKSDSASKESKNYVKPYKGQG